MPDIKRLTFTGNIAHIYRDDGSIVRMIPTVENQWVAAGGSSVFVPPPPPPEGSGTITITAAMIEAAVNSAGGDLGAMVDTSANIAAAYNAAIADTYPDVLSSKNRVACMVGECAQETDWYKTTTEYGTGQSYAPYIGRGFIQLTLAGNYASFGTWCKAIGILSDATYFTDNPTALSDLKWAPYTAIYYFTQVKWSAKNLFEWCDTSSTPWHDISRAINRGDPGSSSASYGEALRQAAIDAVLGVTPDPTGVTPPTGLQDAVAAWMVAHTGDFRYSQASPQRLDPVTYGQSDCSGTVAYAYKVAANNKHIGWWTGTHDDGQQQYGTVIETGTGGSPNEVNMVKGDLIFFNWSGYDPNYDDVKMYIGSNQVSGHGGPGMGPVTKSLSGVAGAAHDWRVRRYL